MRIRGIGRMRRMVSRLRDRLGASAAILMYHRVADAPRDPFALAVTPAHFREHLDILSRRFRPMPLIEFARLHRRGQLPARAVAVTFDDGYVDNLEHAVPLLKAADVPATVFVTSGCTGRRFWWDELSDLILAPRPLPRQGRLDANGSSLDWSIPEDDARPAAHWRPPRGDLTLIGTPLDPRSRLFCDVHRLLMPLPHGERVDALARLSENAHESTPVESDDDARAMRERELLALAREECVEIGGHTVTHPLLSALPPTVQEAEIRESKAHLERLIGRPVLGMSYPWGEYQPQTLSAVRAAGYEYACACGERPVVRSSPIHELPRLNIVDCDGDALARRLEEVFT